MNSILVSGLCKSFDEKKVLDHYSVQIEKGKITCLMGSSGSGKTTLLYLLMGLIEPDQGEIIGMRQQRLGVVFQEDRLCDELNGIENIQLVCGKETPRERIVQELIRVGLEDSLYQPVASLSGGMKRRVALVRALMVLSDIVILDEPFKGMDENLRKLLIQYVKEKISEKTAVIVTHAKEDVDLLEANLIEL